MRYEIRPLGVWDRPVTVNRRSAEVFKSSWDDTLTLLGIELDQLGADRCVIQIDVTEVDLRRDGMLRTHATVGFPGVKIAFGCRYGPLTYATDAYERHYNGRMLTSWQANVRAIALGLHALRAVDRYGVTRRGEQYRGWTALTGTSGEFDMDRDQAAALLAADTAFTPQQILADPAAVKSAYRAAALAHHPDRGGDTELYRRLTAARDLLAGKAGADG